MFDELEKLVKKFDETLNEYLENCTFDDSKSEEKPSECDKSSEKSEPTDGCKLTENVFAYDQDTFALAKVVEGVGNTTEDVNIEFAHTHNDVITPGITERQLLIMLLYRYRNDSEKSDLVKQLLRVVD